MADVLPPALPSAPPGHVRNRRSVAGSDAGLEKAKANFQTARFRLLAWARSQGGGSPVNTGMPPLVPSQTLMTVTLNVPPKTQSVQILGSWDAFSERYPLERDPRRGKLHWKTSRPFNDTTTPLPVTGYARSESGGLVMGQRYYYFFLLNHDVEYYDVECDTTTACPLMPGQLVNYIDVPIELPPTPDQEEVVPANVSLEPNHMQCDHQHPRDIIPIPPEPSDPPPPPPRPPPHSTESIAVPLTSDSVQRHALTAPPVEDTSNKRRKGSIPSTPTSVRARSSRSFWMPKRKPVAQSPQWSPLEPPPIPDGLLLFARKRKPAPLTLSPDQGASTHPVMTPSFNSAPLLPVPNLESPKHFTPPETSVSLPPPPPLTTTESRWACDGLESPQRSAGFLKRTSGFVFDETLADGPAQTLHSEGTHSPAEAQLSALRPSGSYLTTSTSITRSNSHDLNSPASACFSSSAVSSSADQSPYQRAADQPRPPQITSMTEILGVDTPAHNDRPEYSTKPSFDGHIKLVPTNVQNALSAMDDMFDDLGYLGTAII